MRRLIPSLLLLAAPACAAFGGGGGGETVLSTVGVRVEEGTPAATVAAALEAADAQAALVAAPGDAAWFARLAADAGLTLSGPASADGLGLAFLAGEPVGDTAIVLEYDGGSFVVQDALYRLEGERLLDLLAFRVERADRARPVIGRLLEYVATDVMPAAAVIFAVAVPDAMVGDSVARMFSPGYDDALRCEAGGPPARTTGGIRLFYGPEARIRCRAARTGGGVGDWVHATLVVGRP